MDVRFVAAPEKVRGLGIKASLHSQGSSRRNLKAAVCLSVETNEVQ